MLSRRALILMIFFLGVLLILPFAIIWPSVKNIHELSQAILSEYDFLEARQERGEETKRVSGEYEAAKQYQAGLKSLALAPGDEVAFVTNIEKISSEYQIIETLRLDIDRPSMKAGQPTYTFSLTGQGTYSNALAYLHALRGIPVVIDIEAVHFKPAGDVSNEMVSFTIEGYVFLQSN